MRRQRPDLADVDVRLRQAVEQQLFGRPALSSRERRDVRRYLRRLGETAAARQTMEDRVDDERRGRERAEDAVDLRAKEVLDDFDTGEAGDF